MPTTEGEAVRIELRRTYPVPADEMWGRISDFYDLYWLPAVAQPRRLDGRRVRVAALPGDAGEVVEELIEQGGRSRRHKVADAGPMPVGDFEGRIGVENVDETSSEVVWCATFEPVGVSASEAEQAVAGVFAGGFDRLAEV